jgi:hypothetical protein
MSTSLAPVETVLTQVSVWPLYPSVYEINTWVWLAELSQKYLARFSSKWIPSG